MLAQNKAGLLNVYHSVHRIVMVRLAKAITLYRIFHFIITPNTLSPTNYPSYNNETVTIW